MLLIDKLSGKPVYEQIVDGIEHGILLGLYPVGSPLPSVREQSILLSINPNTIQKAYTELSRRGIIFSAPGSGCFVSDEARVILYKEAKRRLVELSELCSELRMAGIAEEDVLNTVEEVYKSSNYESTLYKEEAK